MTTAAATPAQETPKPAAAAVEQPKPAEKTADAASGTADKGKEPAAAATKDAATQSAEQGKETPGKAGETPKAPEKYTLTVPENGSAYVDAGVQAQVEKLARASGWTNEEAQAALNEHVTTMRGLSETYLSETTADAQYGGERLDETKRLARLAIAKVRPEGHPYREPFLKFLNRFAGENNINVVAFLADVGKLFAEDSPAVGKQPGGKPKTAEEVLYPAQS